MGACASQDLRTDVWTKDSRMSPGKKDKGKAANSSIAASTIPPTAVTSSGLPRPNSNSNKTQLAPSISRVKHSRTKGPTTSQKRLQSTVDVGGAPSAHPDRKTKSQFASNVKPRAAQDGAMVVRISLNSRNTQPAGAPSAQGGDGGWNPEIDTKRSHDVENLDGKQETSQDIEEFKEMIISTSARQPGRSYPALHRMPCDRQSLTTSVSRDSRPSHGSQRRDSACGHVSNYGSQKTQKSQSASREGSRVMMSLSVRQPGRSYAAMDKCEYMVEYSRTDTKSTNRDNKDENSPTSRGHRDASISRQRTHTEASMKETEDSILMEPKPKEIGKMPKISESNEHLSEGNEHMSERNERMSEQMNERVHKEISEQVKDRGANMSEESIKLETPCSPAGIPWNVRVEKRGKSLLL